MDNEVETKKMFDDEGFLLTGDLGFLDKDDFLVINGRIKGLLTLCDIVIVFCLRLSLLDDIEYSINFLTYEKLVRIKLIYFVSLESK